MNMTKENLVFIEEVSNREDAALDAILSFVGVIFDSNEYTNFQMVSILEIAKHNLMFNNMKRCEQLKPSEAMEKEWKLNTK